MFLHRSSPLWQSGILDGVHRKSDGLHQSVLASSPRTNFRFGWRQLRVCFSEQQPSCQPIRGGWQRAHQKRQQRKRATRSIEPTSTTTTTTDDSSNLSRERRRGPGHDQRQRWEFLPFFLRSTQVHFSKILFYWIIWMF